MRDEIYQDVTDQMLASLREGSVPWHKPWSDTGGMPLSMSTGKPYRGSNVWVLWLASARKGYGSPYWGTWKHIARLSGMVENAEGKWVKPLLPDGSEDPTPRGVRAGERSTVVIWWKRRRYADRDDLDADGNPTIKTIVSLRTFRVFNADQADALPARFWPQADGSAPQVLDQPEAVWKQYTSAVGAPRVVAAPDAWYQAGPDTIGVPEAAAFESAGEVYSTRFHEAGHSTGHESRLNRPGITEFAHFGDQMYAREELVAEMTAAMLCAVTGIDGVFDNSAAYVAHWLSKLEDDPKLIVSASAAAQRAADLVRGITWDDTEE